MRCLEIEFPFQDIWQFSQYRNKPELIRAIQNYCEERLGDKNVFAYTCKDSEFQSKHVWKCNHCQAHLTYQKEDGKHILKDLCTNHTHPLKLFEKCNPQLFQARVQPKNLELKKQFLEHFQIIVPQQVDSLKNMLKSQWQKMYPSKPIPRLESTFMHNNIYITCKQYRQREKPKCPFKLVYHEMRQTPHIYQLQQDSTQTCHRHLLTFYKELKNGQEFKQDQKKVSSHNQDQRSRFKQYLIDYQITKTGVSRSIFINLKCLIQQIKQKGFQILIPTPEQPKNQNQEDAKSQLEKPVDQDDYFIATNKTGKFLYRSYGATLIISRLFLNQQKQSCVSYQGFCFHSFNFKSHGVFFALALCQNATTTKIKKILKFFYQYFQQKQNLLMIDEADQELLQIVQQLKQEFQNTGIHRFKYKTQLQQSLIDTQIANINVLNRGLPSGQSGKDPLLQNQLFNSLKNRMKFSKQYFYGLSECPIFYSISPQRIEYYFKFQRAQKPEESNNIMRAQKYFKKICTLFEQKNRSWKLIQRERQVPFQKYFNYPTIKRWRLIMGRKSFLALMSEFENVRSCVISVPQSPQFYIVQDHYYSYIVSKDKQQSWNCDCGLRIRTGIPCSHLIKVLIEQKGSIINAVNRFWVIDQGLMNVLTPYIPIKRKSRSRSKVTFLNN